MLCIKKNIKPEEKDEWDIDWSPNEKLPEPYEFTCTTSAEKTHFPEKLEKANEILSKTIWLDPEMNKK